MAQNTMILGGSPLLCAYHPLFIGLPALYLTPQVDALRIFENFGVMPNDNTFGAHHCTVNITCELLGDFKSLLVTVEISDLLTGVSS